MNEENLNDESGWQSRTHRLLGAEAVKKLASANVLVVGIGGVGGYAAEMLVRTGIGNLTLLDNDEVAPSNINRQLIALQSTVGIPKVDLFAKRFLDINPDIAIKTLQLFLSSENVSEVFAGQHYDYVIDAIDTVAPKTALLLECLRLKIPVISSMGAGGRLDPTKIGYFDISETREDGLARTVRQHLKKAGIRRGLRVVASTEAPGKNSVIMLDSPNKRSSFGTIASIPAIFGIFLANHVILKLTNLK